MLERGEVTSKPADIFDIRDFFEYWSACSNVSSWHSPPAYPYHAGYQCYF